MMRPYKSELDDNNGCSQHLLGGPRLNEHSGGLGGNETYIIIITVLVIFNK